MVKIPTNSPLDPFLELQRWFPAKFALKLATIDGVSHIVAEAVGDVGNQFLRLAFGIAEQTVDGLDDNLDEVDVFPLIEPTDIVGLRNLALVEGKVAGIGELVEVDNPIVGVFIYDT